MLSINTVTLPQLLVSCSASSRCYRINFQMLHSFLKMFQILILLICVIMAKTLPTNSVSKMSYLTPPKNCKDIQNQGVNITGIYSIKPVASDESFFVFCDMETRGGGWLYFLNRVDGSEDFYRPWKKYKNGFGNLAREFWLGLEHLYELTGKEVNELLVELVDWNLKKYHIHYETFSVGNEEQNYPLQILGGHSGDLEDSLTYHGGSEFSTIDRDNDNYSNSCAKIYEGGWWYRSCNRAHLTGAYHSGVVDDSKGIRWNEYRKVNPNFQYYNFKEAKMMIKPQSHSSIKI